MDSLINYHLLLYGIGLFLFLVAVLPFILREIRKKKESKKIANQIIPISSLTEEEISRIESRHPSGKRMYPAINKSVCVGCGTCVLTCEKRGTLFLIDGKSTLVKPLSCDGCGDCEQACLTGANQLLEFGSRMKIRVPEIDDHYESNIKGIYIIGSLTGAGLIKEAINQGRSVLNHIMKDVFPDNPPHIVIIGSGPAGLSALLSCYKFGLPATCLEKERTANTIKNFPKKKILMAEPVEIPLFGPLWIGDTTREKLLEVWDRILETTGAKITTEARVDNVVKKRDQFVVSASGQEYVCDKIILAIGTRGEPRKLNVPGETSPKVFYGLVDAKEFTGRSVAVIGAGDSAIETALAFLKQACRVALIVRGDGFPRAKAKNRERLEAAALGDDLKVYFHSAVQEIKPKSLVISVAEEIKEIENDDVFILIGGEWPYSFLEKIGVRIIEKEI